MLFCVVFCVVLLRFVLFCCVVCFVLLCFVLRCFVLFCLVVAVAAAVVMHYILRELVSTTVILTPARVPGVATRARCSSSPDNGSNGSKIRYATTNRPKCKNDFF